MRKRVQENILKVRFRPIEGERYIWSGKARKVCFNGWDGKSYNGETEILPTYYEKFGCHTSNTEYVLKYTRKWGWTIHRLVWNQKSQVWNTDYVEDDLKVGPAETRELEEVWGGYGTYGTYWDIHGNGRW